MSSKHEYAVPGVSRKAILDLINEGRVPIVVGVVDYVMGKPFPKMRIQIPPAGTSGDDECCKDASGVYVFANGEIGNCFYVADDQGREILSWIQDVLEEQASIGREAWQVRKAKLPLKRMI